MFHLLLTLVLGLHLSSDQCYGFAEEALKALCRKLPTSDSAKNGSSIAPSESETFSCDDCRPGTYLTANDSYVCKYCYKGTENAAFSCQGCIFGSKLKPVICDGCKCKTNHAHADHADHADHACQEYAAGCNIVKLKGKAKGWVEKVTQRSFIDYFKRLATCYFSQGFFCPYFV